MIFLCMLYANVCPAQSDIVVKELIENLETELTEDFDLIAFASQLEYYHKHPINLNSATAGKLGELLFINPVQIGNLLTYIRTNGGLLDIAELQAVRGFDMLTIERMLLFCKVEPPGAFENPELTREIWRGDHDLMLRYSRTLEEQKGYTDLPGSRYLGTPFRGLLRYAYKANDLFSVSLVIKKDGGEPMWSEKRLSDFISGNISLGRIGSIKKTVIGDFGLQFGQGLTLWSGFSFGKGADITSITRRDTGLKQYASANEYGFFRGVATTIQLSKKIDITPFFSSRKLDGTLSVPGDDGVLSSINETGLHRTASEQKNKASITQQVTGLNLQYNSGNLTIGTTVHSTLFSHNFVTNGRIYDNFNFTGRQLINTGAYYSTSVANMYLFGEVAKSLNSGTAVLQGVLLSVSSYASVSVLYRNYSNDYHNFFNQGMAEASSAVNEKGFFGGLNISPNKRWLISFYADEFRFDWLKFRIDAPSSGYEFLAQLTHTPSKTTKYILRYKAEQKQQNTSMEVTMNFLEDIYKQGLRLNISWKLNRSISFQHNIEFSGYQKGSDRPEAGFLFYHDTDLKPKKGRLSGNMRLALFKTPSYNSRIYAYENDVLYGFAFGMYNGEGLRSIVNLKYNVLRKIDIWGRYALSYYPGTQTVGSGLDEIQGNKKQEVKVQLRCQF